METYGASMLINKPTRYPIGNQNGNPAILDHLYTNSPKNVINHGIIVNDMRDNYPFFPILQYTSEKNSTGKRYPCS